MDSISIVLPAYNCEPYIRTAVESVLNQSHRPIELIVVDDGSTDGTVQALEPYRRYLRLIQQQNAGAAAARNMGLQSISGQYVAFLDADDWWYPSRLSSQLQALAKFPEAGMVFSDFTVTDATGVAYMHQGIRQWYGIWRDAAETPWCRVFEASTTVAVDDANGDAASAIAYTGQMARWLFSGNFVNTSSVLARREALTQAGLFDTSLSTEEDYDLWLRIARDWPMAYVDAPLVARRRRPGQLTDSSQNEQVTRNVLKVISCAAERLEGLVTPLDIRRRLARLHFNLGVMYLRTNQNAEARRLLLSSVRGQPGELHRYVPLVLSFAPFGVYSGLEWFNRRLRRALRSSGTMQ